MNLNILGLDQYVYKGDGSYTYFLRVGSYFFLGAKFYIVVKFFVKNGNILMKNSSIFFLKRKEYSIAIFLSTNL
jgi:hypothetical protein